MKFEDYNLDTTGYPKEMLVWDHDEEDAVKVIVLGKRIVNTNNDYMYMVYCLEEGLEVWKNAKDLPNTKPRTIEDGLQYGDILIKGDSKRKVLATVDEIIMMSLNNNYTTCCSSCYTLSELIEQDWKLEQPKTPEKEIVELTIEDIVELKGVDPSAIRVKE